VCVATICSIHSHLVFKSALGFNTLSAHSILRDFGVKSLSKYSRTLAGSEIGGSSREFFEVSVCDGRVGQDSK
jgi:hypothetical protein